jgi:hypothetical protein
MPDTSYTCTCTHFCKGYKTGLSRATYYRHAPYRGHGTSQSGNTFSASFQTFLDNSANVSGNGRDTSEDRGQVIRTDEIASDEIDEMGQFENPLAHSGWQVRLGVQCP